MGIDDKIENATDRLAGKGKETVGAATDDDSLRAEGKGQQSEADVKDAGEKAKDALGSVKDAFKR